MLPGIKFALRELQGLQEPGDTLGGSKFMVGRFGSGGSGQSPKEATELWDSATLASFSQSQLDALARIVSGRCPLLSRAFRCRTHGGRFGRIGGNPHRWQELFVVYLDEEADLARRQTLAIMTHAWTNYVLRAWGKDELKPVTGVGADSWGGIGQTLVDSLDTLWIMGFRTEFEQAARWVEEYLDYDKDMNVNTFETTIRQLGGLIAAFALSGRTTFLAKAEDLGKRLLAAFALTKPPDQAAKKEGPAKRNRKGQAPGKFTELLSKFGLPKSYLEAFLDTGLSDEDITEVAQELFDTPPQPQLPFSDVNLRTGMAENLASFVSLAETYVPLEWKALALYTGNCSYAYPQDEVLRIVNRSCDLTSRGFAPIHLRSDGSHFPSLGNRLSLGSRGDSFYEYLVKEVVFAGDLVNPMAQKLWDSFRAQLPSLVVQADPKYAAASAAAARKVDAHRIQRSWRERWRSRRHASRKTAPPLLRSRRSRRPLRGAFGATGGWFESAADADMPWVFLKEVTFSQTVPKMDHLVCFLPGSLALDVYHHGANSSLNGTFAEQLALNTSSLSEERLTELYLAHKLVQTCAHMYFRTASGLAPEITRFNAFGLTDDVGSMHNILRPETVESLFLMWRTTKAQIYRNWGQRILAAFSRTRTAYGYASLHDVNQPLGRRDDMPSFFLAETVKYFFLLFSADEVLPLQDVVFGTEAHPLPVIAKAEDVQWLCGAGSRSGSQKPVTNAKKVAGARPQPTTAPAASAPPPSSPPRPPPPPEPRGEASDNVSSGGLGSLWAFDGATFKDFPDIVGQNPESTFSVELHAKCGGGSGFRSPLTSRDRPPASGYMFYAGPDNRWSFWVGSETGREEGTRRRRCLGEEGADVPVGGAASASEEGEGGGTHCWRQVVGPPVRTGAWTRLLGIVNTSTHEARLYVDGVFAGRRLDVNFVPNRQRPLRLGAGASESSQAMFYFTGEVRDVAVWARDVKASSAAAPVVASGGPGAPAKEEGKEEGGGAGTTAGCAEELAKAKREVAALREELHAAREGLVAAEAEVRDIRQSYENLSSKVNQELQWCSQALDAAHMASAGTPSMGAASAPARPSSPHLLEAELPVETRLVAPLPSETSPTPTLGVPRFLPPPQLVSKPPPRGNPACWVGAFSFEICCQPPPSGNPRCWDEIFTFASCCNATM